MALNDGYATDGQARRIYFPPIGQPRLVPSPLDEAKFNGAVFTSGLVIFGLAFVVFLTASMASGELTGAIVVWMLPLVVHHLAASSRARRWPALNDPNYTYHRFVVSTLRRQGTAWLRCKLVISAILAIGLVVAAGSFAVKVQTDWAVVELGENVDRLFVILVALVAAPFCAIHAYRIHVALRRQNELRAVGLRGEAPNSDVR